MFERLLHKMRDKIRLRDYVMTLHAEDEMNDDELTVYDVECGILTGKIIERQKDKATAEWKYLLRGQTMAGKEIEVITKFGKTGKLVIITLYSS